MPYSSEEARLHAVVNRAVDGVIPIDSRGTIQMFNPACERLFGYRAAEVVGHKVKTLMPAPYAASMMYQRGKRIACSGG